jgi:hypothetical protein
MVPSNKIFSVEIGARRILLGEINKDSIRYQLSSFFDTTFYDYPYFKENWSIKASG